MDGTSCPVTKIESAEAAPGRLGAVLAAPRAAGLTPLGPDGPWLATTPEQSRQVLMDAATFDFPTSVSRSTDLSASAADTRTGHHVFTPLTPVEVERGRAVFATEWHLALAAADSPQPSPHPDARELEAMELLRRPVARATCAAVLTDLDTRPRDEVADLVLAWIDALAPVISSPRAPRRWSRVRRAEHRVAGRAGGRAGAGPRRLRHHRLPRRSWPPCWRRASRCRSPPASWLLVHLAARPDGTVDPDHAVWETLRVSPPTWLTARVTTAPVEVAGQQLPAGAVVLVSPLLLGRLADLAPDTPAALAAFCPERWARDDVRPGAWLPFGAGAHACPGRTLGLALLREVAQWASRHHLALTSSVTIDQSRGILPSPARITVPPREEDDG